MSYYECACCSTIDMRATDDEDDDDTCLCDVCAARGCGESGDDPRCSVLLVVGGAGIYVPQWFASNYNMRQWGISAADEAILLEGPDNARYWDTWSDIDGRVEADFDGFTWVLCQDGDLWARAVGIAQT